MRILVAPCEIAGQYRNLALALRKTGAQCDYYVFENESLRYGGDLGTSKWPGIIRRVSFIRRERGWVVRAMLSMLIEAMAILFFITCLFRYEGFVFGYGRSLLRWNFDLPVLRLFGKKIVANMSHGSDMTPAYIDGALLDSQMQMPSLAVLKSRVVAQRRVVRRFERYANHLIGSPISSSYFASQPFVSIFSIGRVNQALRYTEQPPLVNETAINSGMPDRRIRILHAPSHSPGKGTQTVRAVVDELVAQGFLIEYRELMGKTNEEVIAELKQCDLVLDQVYADLPMSGLAAEAACFGKPTVIAGYDLEALRTVVDPIEFPPSIVCSPDDMLDVVRDLLRNPSLICQAGQRAKSFVYTQWDECAVASRYMRLLSGGEIPFKWWHNPRDKIFLHGYGLSQASSRSMVVQMLGANGVSGLGLQHRPDLEGAFSKYAGGA